MLYDARLLHCGAGNSQAPRALLYVTFRAVGLDPRSLGIAQHSMRSELKGRFRLRHFRP